MARIRIGFPAWNLGGQGSSPWQNENHGDNNSENLQRPELAEYFANITSSDKEVEMEQYRRAKCILLLLIKLALIISDLDLFAIVSGHV
jgi:hypothetical protein